MAGEIIIGGEGRRRKKMGPTARRIRNIVVAVALVSMVASSISWMAEQRRIRQAQVDISRISHATRLFRADHSRCPVDMGELFHPPEGVVYLDPVTDPWGRAYRLVCPSRQSNDGVDVISRGPNGPEDNRDDIQNFIVNLDI